MQEDFCTLGTTPSDLQGLKESDLPVSVQGPLAEAWVSSGLLQGWGHWYKELKSCVKICTIGNG